MDKIIHCAFPAFPCNRVSFGYLVLRLLTGIGIVMHGLGKVGRVEGFAAGVGVPLPLAWLAVFAEVVGGAMLVIGALSPFFSLLLSGNMAFAMLHHIRQGDPFLLKPGGGAYSVGWEFAALYFVAFLALLLAGPGRFSVDYFLFRNRVRK